MLKKYLSVVLGVIVISIILISSVIHLYGEKDRIKNKLFGSTEYWIYANENDNYWAKKVLEGGYILHFRHAERDKWIDVQMYDALESDVHKNGKDESRYAENDYFSQAVCLNYRGKIQARAIGELLSNIDFPFGAVVSSVSCRARQTAELSFGGYDSLHRILVHKGPYYELHSKRLETLIDFYINLPIKEGTNTIVSAHNGVVTCEMFENCSKELLFLEEGGFYVITKRDGKLYLEHEFHNFNSFNMVFFKR